MKKTEKGGLYLGYVEWSGYGGFQEKLLTKLLESDIPLRGVSVSGGTIKGKVSPFHYYTLSEYARKCGVRIRAGKRRGLYFTLSRYKNRLGVYVGLLLFAVILTFHSSRVSDITVTGAPRSQVLNILSECGVTKGASKDGLQLFKAERRLMSDIENCAWADVSIVGTRVSVTVETGTPAPEIEDNTKPRNLVASRDAVIIKQTVRKGSSVLPNGSGVQKGGLLVTGAVEDVTLTVHGSDTGHVLFVRADAEIIGEFNERREFFVPYNETLQIADGEQTRFTSLVYGDDVYPLYLGEAYVDNAVYSEETQLVIIFGAEMPFKLRTGIYTKYRDVEVSRSGDDCVNELRKQKSAFEENFYPEYEIVDAAEMFMPEETGVRLIVDYTLRGDIAEPVDFDVDITPEPVPEPSDGVS